MKKHLTSALCVLCIGGLWGTAQADGNSAPVTTVSEMRSVATRDAVGGASWLTRRKRAVDLYVSTSGLDAGALYTIWVFVFNHPEHCVGDCGPDDLGRDGVDSSVFWGTGFVASDSGTEAGGVANTSFRIKRGQFPGQALSGNGLTNVRGAEIHFQLRTHGAPIPGRASEQLTTAAGACDTGACQDQQFGIHIAVDSGDGDD